MAKGEQEEGRVAQSKAQARGEDTPEAPTSYEELVARLEAVTKRLESGTLPLEESLAAFEEGIGLVRAGEARLAEAERRVELLLAGPEGERSVPLEGQSGRER